MRRKEKAVLTSKEWNLLRHAIRVNLSFFCERRREDHVLNYVFSRTVEFWKFSESIAASEIETGSISHCLLPAVVDKAGRWRAFDWLVRRKIVLRLEDGSLALNVPGMLGAVIELFSRQIELPEANSKIQELAKILEKVGEYYANQKWQAQALARSGKIMKIEEAIELARMKSQEALERKEKKRRTFKAVSVVPLFKEACKKANVPYDNDWEDRNRMRMLGSAKHWLVECEKSGEDVKKLIIDVCRYWTLFSGSVKRAGKKVPLNSAPSFLEYFKYRREINEWVRQKRAEPERQYKDVKVIYLGERR